MEDRDYRSEVGKKIEEALANGDFDLIEDLIEVPPMETFMQWAEKGEEKRKNRACRKRILVSCVAVCVIALSAMVAVKCFSPPEVEADPDESIGIELNDMESVTTYKTWNDLPDDIKEQFIEVKDLPDGYVIEKVEVFKSDFAVFIKGTYKNPIGEIVIREYRNDDGGLHISTVAENNTIRSLANISVYVEENVEYKTITYKYVIGDIMVDITVPEITTEEEVIKIIKTVQ